MLNTEQRMEEIEKRLEAAFQPSRLEVVDEGHKHVGHAGARDGRGHFRVLIRSEKFAGMPLVQRHRLVYQAMGQLMQSDIHALAIDAAEPES